MFWYNRGSHTKVITQELYIIGGGHIAGKIWHLYQKTFVVFNWEICDSLWYRKALGLAGDLLPN